MGTLDDFTAASRELLNVLGDSEQGTVARGAVVSPPLTLYVSDSLQEAGQYSRVVAGKRTVGAMNADWVFEHGDVVTVRGRTAKVADLLDNDGIVNTVALHG